MLTVILEMLAYEDLLDHQDLKEDLDQMGTRVKQESRECQDLRERMVLLDFQVEKVRLVQRVTPVHQVKLVPQATPVHQE